MGEIKKRWYVVRAVSGKEKKVKEYLELEIARMKLTDYVNQVLIPTEKVFKIQNGKKVNKEKAFLPGYVLIEAALVGEVPHVIKSIPNVIGFLGTEKGGDPVPMRLSEVNRILGKVDELAETEEEMKEMILGSWALDLGRTMGISGKNTHIMEFSENGLYREITFEGSIDDWNSVDTVGYYTGGGGIGKIITFEDSVYYEIENDIIYFSTLKKVLPYSNWLPYNKGIRWVKPNKLNINSENHSHGP